MSPLEIRRRNVYRPGDATPTGQILRDSVAGEEVLERAAEAAEFERLRARLASARSGRAGSGTIPGSPLRTGVERLASGIGLALAWHGAGFTGIGEVHLASVASVELTAHGPSGSSTASTEMGQGTKTIFPQLVAEALGVPFDEVEIAPDGHRVRARLRADRRQPHDDGRRRVAASGPPHASGPRSRRRPVGRFADTYREHAASHGPIRIDQRFEPYPGVAVRRRDIHAVTPTRRSAGRRASPGWTWTSTPARCHVRDVVAADDIGRVVHPVLAEGQVEGGTLQAVGYATIEEIKLVDGRYLNDRLATYIIPTVARCAAHLDDPGRGAVRRRPARGEGSRRAADGRRGARGHRRDRRCDRGLDHATCRPARSGSWPR